MRSQIFILLWLNLNRKYRENRKYSEKPLIHQVSIWQSLKGQKLSDPLVFAQRVCESEVDKISNPIQSSVRSVIYLKFSNSWSTG